MRVTSIKKSFESLFPFRRYNSLLTSFPMRKMAKPSGSGKTAKSKVYRILLTGGPCAGKTTSLAKLQAELDGKGFRVYCVPEAATLMMKGGAILDTSKNSWDFKVQMQTSLLKT
jgi:signal recognition particle GTPase